MTYDTPGMNRRQLLGGAAALALGGIAGGCRSIQSPPVTSRTPRPPESFAGFLQLLPYPQSIAPHPGMLPLGFPRFGYDHESPTILLVIDCLLHRLPRGSTHLPVRLGSVAEGYRPDWISQEDSEFLHNPKTSSEASVVSITRDGVTVVGKSKWGMLYGVQTVCQLVTDAIEHGQPAIPCLSIRDWPDLQWRCLAPTLTWYSGWNRLEGYDLCNWSEDEWKWLADWSLLHKCNAWAVCMYGYWPFKLPGYEQETLDVDSFRYNPKTKKKEPWRFTHPNIRREFFPEVIRYANQRGIQVHAYIGKNSFNGCKFRENRAIYAGGAAELLPFAPGVDEYWGAFINRIVDLGFDGFVFEDPESNHVPNQNAQCYETFWKPWEQKYGYSSIEKTDQNKPPLGVHIEYYTWLYRTFADKIRTAAERTGRPQEIRLISHVLLARIMSESKTQEERKTWIDLVDQRQGEKVQFIIAESNESKYVELLGGDRVASLGGRGGSCTCAMRRIASVNNNWDHGPFGADLAYERDCQRRIVKAGGFGAMGYVFEWTNTEAFGYLAAQHLWRSAGIPSINNTDQAGILNYAYRLYYGDGVGRLAARAIDEGADVNDAMVLEGVYGSQYPSTGKALHRDYQLLAAMADHAESLARQAFRLYTGRDPELFQPAYDEESFRWNGYDRAADRTFKSERLRLLWISTRRSQEMCQAALAHRLAQRLIAERAAPARVLQQYDRAIAFATENQLIYQCNYYDDYDSTDGLCSVVTDRLRQQRAEFLAGSRALPQQPVLYISWEKLADVLPSKSAAHGSLQLRFALGLTQPVDYFCIGVVFSIALRDGRDWRTIFRRTIHRRASGWEDWEVPLPHSNGRSLRLRFVTDSYSRAQNRAQATWNWALWGQPQLVRGRGTNAEILYDFVDHLPAARRFVRLDRDGKDRAFDEGAEDSTGATFAVVSGPSPGVPAIAAFTPHRGKQFGLTVAEYEVTL